VLNQPKIVSHLNVSKVERMYIKDLPGNGQIKVEWNPNFGDQHSFNHHSQFYPRNTLWLNSHVWAPGQTAIIV